jgi:hypothetical protein
MRIIPVAITFVILSFLISDTTLGQPTNWLIYGTVRWSTGTAAASVKLRLLQNGQEKAIVYANQEGRYGFFNVPGLPSEYNLEVWFGDRLLRTFTPNDMTNIQRGGYFDIQLQR